MRRSPALDPRDQSMFQSMTAKTPAERDVLKERARQISQEGWTPEHDDEHSGGEIADAAACYAAGQILSAMRGRSVFNQIWPWASSWWKPRDRRSNLVRAGALIIAEIERLDRAAKPEADHG